MVKVTNHDHSSLIQFQTLNLPPVGISRSGPEGCACWCFPSPRSSPPSLVPNTSWNARSAADKPKVLTKHSQDKTTLLSLVNIFIHSIVLFQLVLVANMSHIHCTILWEERGGRNIALFDWSERLIEDVDRSLLHATFGQLFFGGFVAAQGQLLRIHHRQDLAAEGANKWSRRAKRPLLNSK